jgi:putative flippase GtrA
MLHNLLKIIQAPMLRFIIAGIGAVATDLLFYRTALLSIPHAPAKGVGFLAGTVVAYLLNKYWTWQQPKKSNREAIRFIALYAGTFIANIAINQLTIFLSHDAIYLGFFMATGTSTVLNFIGQKFWVFQAS